MSYPLVERPWTSLILVLFILFLSYGLWFWVVIPYQIPAGYYIFGFILFFAEMLPYFTPAMYEIYEDRVVAKFVIGKMERNFADVKCFYRDKRGVMLSPYRSPRRMDTFRGLSLRFSVKGDEKQALLPLLRTKIEKEF